MPRHLLISRDHGSRALKTYGVKKVQTNMKFSFIIAVVTVFLWCGIASAETRLLNDLKYLEYLNDLDRRNVEVDDIHIHKQWPFHNIARNLDDEDDVVPLSEQQDIEREKLLQVLNIAKAEMASKHNQNYRDRLFEKLEDGFKQMKETSDRADLQLSQYRRYKPIDQEALEEARMYPERNEEEVGFNDDDGAYQNTDDMTFDDEDEVVELRPPLPRPFFPRIATMGKPINFENTFRDSDETEDAEPEEEIIRNVKPSFPKAYFPRIAPVDIPVNYKIDGLSFGKQNVYSDHRDHTDDMHHHQHEEYKFKDGEEFPKSNMFNEVPIVEDPSEFGVGPKDPRFNRDLQPIEDTVTLPPRQQDTMRPYIVKDPYVSKPKMNSRSDLQNQLQSDRFPLSESYKNKDVEVVQFKSDDQADSAGVYIIAIIAGISAAATVGLIAVGIGWYNLQKHMKNAEDSDYPSYGIVGPNKDYEKKERDDAGDRRLAQSAQMYHYQHQKQQIIAMGRNPQGHGSQSDSEEEEDEEGNYTVYECPGLASIEGPLEVKNPMFDDDQLATPSQTPLKVTNAEDAK